MSTAAAVTIAVGASLTGMAGARAAAASAAAAGASLSHLAAHAHAVLPQRVVDAQIREDLEGHLIVVARRKSHRAVNHTGEELALALAKNRQQQRRRVHICAAGRT